MAGMISVKGIRRLIDGITDHVVESVKKLSKIEGSGGFEVGGTLDMDGKFYEEVEGELSFEGTVGVDAVVPVSGVPADVNLEAGGGIRRGWEYGGKGPIQLRYYVKYKSG
jgi:hypothetical protein